MGGAILTASSGAEAADPGPVEWNDDWPRFHIVEGVATVGFTVGSYLADSKLSVPESPNIRGGFLFDNAVRGVLRGRSEHVQRVFADYSDWIYKTQSFFPYVVDVGVVALGVHHDVDVAAQMFLINAQSLSLTGMVALLSEHLVGRQRPYVQDCGPNNRAVGHACGTPGDNQSFFSGHAAATFTSAGLTCVHHQHLPLYGGGAPDTWACIWALTLATSTGLFRIISDNHYLSDVLTGAALGFASGYLLPSWLHYGFGSKKGSKLQAIGSAGTIAPMPMAFPGGAGLGLVAIF